MEQTKRQMNGAEWAWLVIFQYYRAIYLAHGGWALLGAIVGSMIPLVNVGVAVWGLLALHQVYGCKTTAIAIAIYIGAMLVLFGFFALLGG